MSEGWLRQILTVRAIRAAVFSARGLEQVLGRDGEFDQCVKTRVGSEVEDGFRLLLAQHQGRGMRFLQTLKPMPQHEPLAEVQRGPDIGKPDRLEKEFMTSAGEKFPLRKDSRPGALVW